MITIIIIIITVLISLLAFSNENLFAKLKFHPYSVIQKKEWYRCFSHALIHADLGHLFINMFVLYSFGSSLEYFFKMIFGAKGIIIYLLIYVTSVAASTIASLNKHKDNIYYGAVGASGAVSAVLFANILINPLGKIMFILIPIPIPAFIFGILYLIYSAYMAKRNADNIGHDAHFYGAVYGMMATLLFKPSLILLFFKQIFYFFN